MDRLPSNLPIDGHSYRRVEVLTGAPRRRHWSTAEKAAIVAESFAPGERSSAPLDPPTSADAVHHRAALFAPLTPEQRMNAPVAVGRLTGDQHLDLGDKFRLGLRTPTATLPGPLRCRLSM